MAAGYSGTPLLKKLGIKPGFRAAFIDAPDQYDELLGPLPEKVEIASELESLDFVQVFCRMRSDLEQWFDLARDAIVKNGMLWVSWYKKASKIETDLDENIIRNWGLDHGLVDVKVCAVDAHWSGLKFVYRKEDR